MDRRLNHPANALTKFPWMGQILAGTVAEEWVRLDSDATLAGIRDELG